VYFVEDFEDDYVAWSTLSLSSQVVMQGTILRNGESISTLNIYFDSPTPLPLSQLDKAPYNGSYGTGSYVGLVVPPLDSNSHYMPPEKGILMMANTWSTSGQNFNLSFDMSAAFAQCGKGVYTIYLWTDSNNCLTTLCVWN